MGKYMRKCRGASGKVPATEVTQVVGVRTRSRSATLAASAAAVPKVGSSKRRKVVSSPAAASAARHLEKEIGGRDGDGCYLHLRSRRLFMATAAAPRGQRVEAEAAASSGASDAVVMAGVSGCSSTASSVDVAPRERNDGAAEVSNSGCGGKERRETTPSSRAPDELSDVDSCQTDGRAHHHRRFPATATAGGALPAVVRARMPPPAEIEEFFAAAEKAEAERFAAKYNFDVVRGVPLAAGRFEWAPVVSG